MDRPLSTKSIPGGSLFASQNNSLPKFNTGVTLVTAPKHPEPYLSIHAQALLQDNCRVHCGMVRKENKYKKWQDRYLVLHKGCLYYYKDSNDKKAKGQFSLSGYRLSNAPERSKFQWTFKLTHIQPEKRTYYFAAHSDKERSEWFDKIQQDLNEYCDPRPTYNIPNSDSNSSSSSSGSSFGSIEEGDKDYDYPEVYPVDIEEMKLKFLQGVPTPSIPVGSTADDATYCPPPEFFLPTGTASKKGQLPPTPSSKPLHQQAGFGSISTGKGSVDVSKILRPELSSIIGGVVTNKAAVDIANVLSQGIMHRNQTTPRPVPRTRPTDNMSKSPHIPHTPHKPLPPPKPKKPDNISRQPSSMPSSVLPPAADSTEEMYLELSNHAPEEPLPIRSTLQRIRPDGNSFKIKDTEQTSIPDMDVLPQSAFRLDYNRTNAIPLLTGYEGAYMIHSSSKGDINQSLSVYIGEKVKHYLLFYNQDGYALDPNGQRFPSIETMLQHFHEKPLPNQQSARLRMPYK